MIYHDKIMIVMDDGQELGPFPAQVNPIRSSESVKMGQPPLTSYYRLLIGSYGGDRLNPSSVVKWRGRSLAVQGDVEPWIVTGRLHHYEATLKVG